jgi:rhamnose transport system ATP-binding protein
VENLNYLGDPVNAMTRVYMHGISKSFDVVKALSNVDLLLFPGEVHTIAGENGSGKSTLLRILGGVLQPDEGKIQVDGLIQEFPSVRSAMRLGVTMVSQELSLVPNLSIAENVFLGHNQTKAKFGIDWRDTEKRASQLLKRLNLDVDPKSEVASLPLHEQQLIEIARALAFETRVLLLDEPTSSLAPNEVASLFTVVRQLRDQGVAVVLISHRMSEMLEISDRFTVLRDGKLIDSAVRSEVDENWLIDRMVLNRPAQSAHITGEDANRPVVLKVRGLTDRFGAFNEISFDLRKGEITGLAGLAGAGRTELVESLAGFRPREGGEVTLGSATVRTTTRQALNSGIALVPDDRRTKSTIHDMSVRENLLLSQHKLPLARRSKSQEAKIVKEWIDKLRIKSADIDTPIKNLSGGNQQKVVIARCLQTNPQVLLLDEPTRGIDLGAKAEIYELLRNLAAEGLSILAVSSELIEIFEISDRILVMHAGSLTADMSRSKANEGLVVAAATGSGL